MEKKLLPRNCADPFTRHESRMQFGVWNIAKTESAAAVAAFLKHYSPDHLILVECSLEAAVISQALQAENVTGYNLIQPIGPTSITIISRLNPGSWVSIYDQDRASIFEVSDFGMPSLLVCAVHLPSKLHQSPLAQAKIASDLVEEIKRAEQSTKISRTIVTGDFNMNPYDIGMATIHGFNAVSCKRVASSNRRFNRKPYDFFYNPCWNLMGDFVQPAGTYFFGSPDSESSHWNHLDQVIVRPSLAEAFIPQSLEVVTQIGERMLSTINGRPSKQVSDHYPIRFSLDLSKVTS